LLVVIDGDDSTKGWKSLFENPGVIEVHELHEKFLFILRTTVLSTKLSDIPLTLVRKIEFAVWGEKNRDFETKGVDQSPPGVTLPEWEGNGN